MLKDTVDKIIKSIFNSKKDVDIDEREIKKQF